MSKQYGIQARLKVGGSVKDISSFRLQVATAELGATLSCLLSNFSATLDASQPAKFEIGITKGGDTDWATLLDDGRIVDRSSNTNPQGDRRSINVVSKLARLWKQTPRRPITLFDPAQADIVTETSRGSRDVVDSSGNPIEPIYNSMEGFELNQLLEFVYGEKLGFESVITNIPNYPLQRADFTLTSPYHSVAASQVALFEPKYTSESLARLFIVDPQGTLPDGFPSEVRSVGPNAYVEFQETEQTAAEINAVLLSYRDSTTTGEEEITDRVDQEIQEAGTFGGDDWQRTLINRFIKEFHNDLDNPERITREIVWKIETRISAKADGLVREVSIETQTDLYDSAFQLKKGYTKTLQLYTKLPGESAIMRACQTETNRIVWVGSMSSPTNLLKTWEITEVNGTIIVEGEEGDPDNPQVKTSLYEANRNNNIPDDAEAQLAKPISTLIERWREIGPDQIEVAYQKVDHLTGRPEQNKTVQHTGTVVARLGNNKGRQVTMLLRDEESEATDGTLPPATLDAGDIPFATALELANRVLARHGQQPQRVSISFAGIDVALRRGSLRKVSDRAGNEFLTFITGYTITGENLGTPAFSIKQQAEGIVLQEL